MGCFAECCFNKEGNKLIFQCAMLGAIEFHGAQEKQENVAWHILIRAIQESPDYLPTHKYAIMTDADLGMHGAYNNRTAPYFQNNFLPSNFTLIYAFDKGQSLGNQAIKRCDKQAKQMIQRFKSGEIKIDGASEVPSGVCSHFRGWLNGNDSLLSKKWYRINRFPRDTLDNTKAA